MDSIINIELRYQNQLVATCNYMLLESHAEGFIRQITFIDVKFVEDSNELLRKLYFEKIEVAITINSSYYSPSEFANFEILLLEFQNNIVQNWVVSGPTYIDSYRTAGYYWQPTIDVLHQWQNNKSCRHIWFTEEATADFKSGYIDACFYYSSMPSNFVKKDAYLIDWRLVQDEKDFLFLISEQFYGERGYFGKNMHAFFDCLLLVQENGVSFRDQHFIFKNVDFLNKDVEELYKEVYDKFIIIGITIIFKNE
jgi:hypothetical protein